MNKKSSWNVIQTNYFCGQRRNRRIRGFKPGEGVVIQLEPDVDGLARIDHLYGLAGRNPEDCLHPGHLVSVTILSIDPVRQCVEVSAVVPKDDSNGDSMADWVAEHPGETAAAVEWLRHCLQNGPLHGALLGELTKRWGVPRPVSSFVTAQGFAYFRSGTDHPFPQHPLVALRERVHDSSYWSSFQSHLPADVNAHQIAEDRSGTERTVTPDTSNQSVERRILLDGSNLVGLAPFGYGGRLLVILWKELQVHGFSPYLVLDGKETHYLNRIQDKVALRFLEQLKRESPDRLLVTTARKQADPYLLAMSQKWDCPILSGDAFRDFDEQYPWLRDRDHPRVYAPGVVGRTVFIPEIGLACDIGASVMGHTK